MEQQGSNWQQQAWRPPEGGPQPFSPQPQAWPGSPYGMPPAPPVPPRKSRGWIVALVAVVLFFALLFAGLASCTRVLTSATTAVGGNDVSVLDTLSGDAVGVITVSGTIQYDGTTASPEGLKAQLDRAEQNPHIKAVVLRVDSGGGTATAGEEMCAYVRDFSKPIVVSSASMNASAAYEISSQADYLFTAKTTAIGAIGTALQVTDTSELMDKLGISVDNITSAKSKDASYGTRPLTDEERAYYQQMVDQINETFLQSVAEGRGMSVDEVRALATGMTFTGIDAVANGLADEIGTKEDAVEKAAALAGVAGGYQVVDLAPESDDLFQLLNLLSRDETDLESLTSTLKELGYDGSPASR